MSSESPHTTPLAEITQGPSAFEAFLDRNQKFIIAAAILIAIATAGFVIYRGVEKSLQETAGAALTQADDLNALDAVIAEHAGTQAAKSAQLLLADQQWQSGQKEDAIATLKRFIDDNPDHPAKPTAKASLGSKWMIEGKSDRAVATFEELADDPQARHLAPYALICIGDIARAAGDAGKAEEAYTRVSADFPESAFTNIAKARLSTLKAKAPTVIEPPAIEAEPAAATEAPAEVAVESPTAEAPAPVESSAPEAPEEAPKNSDS